MRESYNSFRFMDSYKSFLFMKGFDELDKPSVLMHHYLRPLYSSADSLTSVIGDVKLLKDLCSDINRFAVAKID